MAEEEIIEEIPAVDIEEIGKRYEEKGFFTRLKDMLSGLGKPHDTREYKEARIELQRLSAPIAACVLVVLFVVVLCVVTAVQNTKKATMDVTVAKVEETSEETLEEIEDPPDEEIDMTQDVDVSQDIQIDVPQPQMANPAPPSPNPGGEPDKVAAAPSPVTMNAGAGTVKMRGLGSGDGGGFGTLIGGGKGGQNIEGCLIGTIIDIKSDKEGKPKDGYSPNTTYYPALQSLVKNNFSEDEMAKHFVPNKRVALTHCWIKPQSAGNGPVAFGVQDVMKPSGFCITYRGEVKSAVPKKIRLWGYFDDVMYVTVNGKTVLDSRWNVGGAHGQLTEWSTKDKADIGKVACPQSGGKMCPGDWFTIDPKHPADLLFLVGECPGGMIGGLLLVQEDGVEYPKNADGTMKLPLFCSRPLSTKERMKYNESADSKWFSVDNSPRFNAKAKGESSKAITKDDVSVDVSI